MCSSRGDGNAAGEKEVEPRGQEDKTCPRKEKVCVGVSQMFIHSIPRLRKPVPKRTKAFLNWWVATRKWAEKAVLIRLRIASRKCCSFVLRETEFQSIMSIIYWPDVLESGPAFL